MSDRKITIKIDEKHLLDIIEELKIGQTKRKLWKPKELYLTLNLPDTKSTYEYLSKSKKILDWNLGDYSEFEDSNEDIKLEEEKVSEDIVNHPATKVKERIEEEIKVNERPKKMDKFTEFVYDYINSDDKYLQIGTFIEATWKVARKSPGIVFGTPLFRSTLENEIKTMDKTPTVERALLKKIVESYYAEIPDDLDVIQDIKDKFLNKWKSVASNETISSVAVTLFRNA